ncbi:MAG: D-aminoacyl-tRNA deacylase [Actinomycetales bacterium]|jgi:D-tyrosyl-tRNA(Tyr) deacylase
MRAVLQRAMGAQVQVDGVRLGGFDGPGLVALIGVTHDDTAATAAKVAEKLWNLRIFPAQEGGKEASASDLGLPILVISQFTLYADTRKGRRPTWDAAAPGPVAEPLVSAVIEALQTLGATVSTGRFGADMQVTFTNDGPMTILLEV